MPIIAIFFIGCRTTNPYPGVSIASHSNSSRNTLAWDQAEEQEKALKPVVCLEPIGPAAKERTLIMSGSSGDAKASIDYHDKIVTLYTVTEVMQFGHLTMFNLCQMYGNGVINKEQYAFLHSTAMANMRDLLEIAMKRDKPVADKDTKKAEKEQFKSFFKPSP